MKQVNSSRNNLHVFVCLLVGLAVLSGCQGAAATPNTVSNQVWTGFLEGKTVDVSAQVAGRLTGVFVQEGDPVQADQKLATLDDDLMQARIAAADANVAAAQAQLALLQAGTRPEDIRKAQAQVEQAQATLVSATQAYSDTVAIRDNPQALLIAQASAQTNALVASTMLTATLKQAQAADAQVEFWDVQAKQAVEGVDVVVRGGYLLHFSTSDQRKAYAQSQRTQAGNAAWQAWAAVTLSQANILAANAGVNDVTDQITNPVALNTRVDQARAARDRAQAAVAAAQAALQVLQEGASPAQIQAARDALTQAQYARAALDKEAAHYQINALVAGTVQDVFYRKGEVVGASAPIIRLSTPGDLTLRVFVPVSTASQVQVGQSVSVWSGELNSKPVTAKVKRVADQAEFTDRQFQTDSERNAQLIAVEIDVSGASSEFKDGMPANVVFGPPPSAGLSLPQLSLGDAPTNTFSGTLESHQTHIAAEVNGQVLAVRVNKSDAVKSGDVLISLDDTTVKTSLSEAQAAVSTAQSNLNVVNEKPRTGTLALADAGLAQAQADLQAASAAQTDANNALTTHQDLTTQLDIWQGKARAAFADVARNQALVNAAQAATDEAAKDKSFAGKTLYTVSQKQQDAAQATLAAAQANLDGSARVYDLYKKMIDNPLELLAAQHAAANQVAVAQAGVKIAQAQSDIARRGPQPEAVALAEARLKAAQANLALVAAQVKRYTIASPTDGTIVDRTVEPGETTMPGSALLTIANTQDLEMTVYVPIRLLGTIKLGQAAVVKSPTLPGKTYAGKVTYISPESQFKPANVYNSQDRSEMVFSVKVTVPASDGALKAGLPADATLQ